MNAEYITDYCLAKEDVTSGFPFGPETLVFKINEKVFCLMGLDRDPLSINLKCDPELAMELREQHPAVIPGYHMNKKHWNTVSLDGSLTTKQIKEFIDHSYNLVKPKKKRK
jgi:predicted DNA-binding protein (MmcQ/YjbR family)